MGLSTPTAPLAPRATTSESPAAWVNLSPLMARSIGDPRVNIALLDGPLAVHDDLRNARIRVIGSSETALRGRATDPACQHATFVAGVLSSARDSAVPGVCPGCTLVVRPIFEGGTPSRPPVARPRDVATALVEAVDAGAHVVNLSVAMDHPGARADEWVTQALEHAARRSVLVVAAAGNRPTLGSSVITRHPWVIPVTACDRAGRPTSGVTLGSSAGRRGVGGPGVGVRSLSADGGTQVGGGTSAAAAFVTGTIALLRSLVPDATAAAIRSALIQGSPRRSVSPPMLDAAAALAVLTGNGRR